MAKRLHKPKVRSLTERLQIALDFTVTEKEKNEVYALLDHLAQRTLTTTPGEFYSNLRQICLEVGQYQGIPSEYEIENGRRLANELISINHQSGKIKGERGYGPQQERSRMHEFEIIRKFYNGKA